MNVALVYANNVHAVGRGAGLIAGAVRRAGHMLDFYDTVYTPAGEVAARLLENDPDVVLFSSMTMGFPEASQIAREIKERADIPTLIGGLHATVEAPAVVSDHPEFDYACVGEGETVVVEFLDALAAGVSGTDSNGREAATADAIDNLVFMRDGAVVANPVRPPEDLSGIPEFPWDLFPEESILGANRMLPVSASRGCPFKCTYCCNDSYLELYGRGYLRFRPVQDILDEIVMLRDAWHPRLFYFEDEMLFFDRERATELFRGLAALGVNYGAMARVEYLKPDIVDVLRETGCRYVAIGLECGDETFRREMLNRKMSDEQIGRALGLLKDAGIYVKTFNMIGYPVDDDDRLTEATIEMNARLAPDASQFTIFYPFPGTKLYDYAVENDLVDPDKAGQAKGYYEDSVLRGVTLKDRQAEIQARFDTPRSRLRLRRALSDGSLRSRLGLARAAAKLYARRLAGKA